MNIQDILDEPLHYYDGNERTSLSAYNTVGYLISRRENRILYLRNQEELDALAGHLLVQGFSMRLKVKDVKHICYDLDD